MGTSGTGIMVGDAEGARRWANWDAERRQPGWIGRLSNVALVLAIAGAGIEALHLSQLFSGNKTGAAAAAIIGLAAIMGVAAFAARSMHVALAGRVDILSQALEASPDAPLIIAPDGRTVYANTAFYDLFPHTGEVPLTGIAAALADPESTRDFERPRRRAATGTRAIAALPLRDSRGAAAGWFSIAVNPIAGRPGYSFWNFQDITARQEIAAGVRSDCRKAFGFLL